MVIGHADVLQAKRRSVPCMLVSLELLGRGLIPKTLIMVECFINTTPDQCKLSCVIQITSGIQQFDHYELCSVLQPRGGLAPSSLTFSWLSFLIEVQGLVFFSFKSCVSQLSVEQISRNLVHF